MCWSDFVTCQLLDNIINGLNPNGSCHELVTWHKELLGHASIETTERYAHLAPENLRQAVSALDGLSRIAQVVDETRPGKAA